VPFGQQKDKGPNIENLGTTIKHNIIEETRKNSTYLKVDHPLLKESNRVFIAIKGGE